MCFLIVVGINNLWAYNKQIIIIRFVRNGFNVASFYLKQLLDNLTANNNFDNSFTEMLYVVAIVTVNDVNNMLHYC